MQADLHSRSIYYFQRQYYSVLPISFRQYYPTDHRIVYEVAPCTTHNPTQ